MRFSFDECFQSFPTATPPANLRQFWEGGLAQLRRIPVDPRQKMVLSRSLGRESQNEISFASAGGQRLHGFLAIPRRRGRVPVVISFHDYQQEIDSERSYTQHGVAHLSFWLRGHQQEATVASADQAPAPPALLQDAGLEPPENSYLFGCFLDAVRAIDFLKLNRSIDSQRIGVVGRGLGAAMAVFAAAAMPENVKALALERPALLWSDCWLSLARSPLCSEARRLLDRSQRARSRGKRALLLFDGLNWSAAIKQPTLVQTGLDDELNPPRPAFGFFNRLQTDKTMEIFTEEPPEGPLRAERLKSLQYLSARLSNEDGSAPLDES
ncbi:MAG: acetylxylan esterase [Leptospirales bacterium]|nr:acetylxylan esterase [Leptospirales bacterium]